MKYQKLSIILQFFTLLLTQSIMAMESVPLLKAATSRSNYRSTLNIQEPIDRRNDEIQIPIAPIAPEVTWLNHTLPPEIWSEILDYLPKDEAAWNYLARYFGITLQYAQKRADKLAHNILGKSLSYQEILDRCERMTLFKTAKNPAAHQLLKQELLQQFTADIEPWQKAVQNSSLASLNGLITELVHIRMRNQMAIPADMNIANLPVLDDSGIHEIVTGYGRCRIMAVRSINIAFTHEFKQYLATLLQQNRSQAIETIYILRKLTFMFKHLELQAKTKANYRMAKNILVWGIILPLIVAAQITSSFIHINNSFLLNYMNLASIPLIALFAGAMLYDLRTAFQISVPIIALEISTLANRFIELTYNYQTLFSNLHLAVVDQQVAIALQEGLEQNIPENPAEMPAAPAGAAV